ncbi:MAG: DUF6173 family protein [Pseudomonadota bacterium]
MTDQTRTAARAVRADAPASASAENQPLPAALTAKSPAQKSPVEWAYQRLVLYIRKFEESLDAEHEVGLGFAGSDAGTLHIQGLGYFAPDILTFYGRDPSGMQTHLVQHVSQLNVMLKAAPKQAETPTRIGFVLSQDLEAGMEDGGGEPSA